LNTDANFLNATSGPNTIKGVFICPGGATIDDGGTAITIANALLAPTGSGVSTIAVANGGSGYVGAPMVSILGGSGTGLATFTVRQAGATTFGGTIADGAGNGTHQVALVLSGSGTLTLSGIDTYTGITEVLSGKLVVTSPAAIKDGNNLYVGSAGSFFALVVDAATAAVPEPGTMALLAAAVAMIAAARRRMSLRFDVQIQDDGLGAFGDRNF
jgi:autotransporter-associated beta strand protein